MSSVLHDLVVVCVAVDVWPWVGGDSFQEGVREVFDVIFVTEIGLLKGHPQREILKRGSSMAHRHAGGVMQGGGGARALSLISVTVA